MRLRSKKKNNSNTQLHACVDHVIMPSLVLTSFFSRDFHPFSISTWRLELSLEIVSSLCQQGPQMVPKLAMTSWTFKSLAGFWNGPFVDITPQPMLESNLAHLTEEVGHRSYSGSRSMSVETKKGCSSARPALCLCENI